MPVSMTLDLQFTEKQGQYLAFIYAYTLLNRQAPAEADFQRFFLVTPPTVHQMIVTLERRRWINRVPGSARSIQLLVPAEHLPVLQPIEITETRY
jgi:DNA-binding MarR family transcriptional regulator